MKSTNLSPDRGEECRAGGIPVRIADIRREGTCAVARQPCHVATRNDIPQQLFFLIIRCVPPLAGGIDHGPACGSAGAGDVLYAEMLALRVDYRAMSTISPGDGSSVVPSGAGAARNPEYIGMQSDAEAQHAHIIDPLVIKRNAVSETSADRCRRAYMGSRHNGY
jgi:hypothetical protein